MSPVSVLIVDDHESFRRIARSVVEATDGFTVAGSAASGEESVEAAERLRPDLVLMDVNLPGIDGIEAARRLSALAHPPVVFLLSTYNADEFDPAALECGAVTYIAKSVFDPNRLVEAWTTADGTASTDT